MNGVIFPIVDADGVRLTSLRLGPPSAYTYLQHLAKRSLSMRFQSPRSDADFTTAAGNLVDYATANMAALGLVAGDLTAVAAARTDWESKYPAAVAAQNASIAATDAKNVSRPLYEEELDLLVAKMAGSGQMDSAEAAAMGLNVPDTEPTPVAAPTTRPVVNVDFSQRFTHVIHFSDEALPGSTRKPEGVRAVHIFNKVGGTPPATPDDVDFLATDTRTPYTVVYDGSEAGQIAYYMLRWENTRGEFGPWSETVSATIGA